MIESPERHCKTVTEIKNVAIDFRGEIATTELLIGTPTLVPVTPSDIAVGIVSVSTEAIESFQCTDIPIGQGIEAPLSGGSPGRHSLIATVTTDAGQRLQTRIVLDVLAD